MIKKTIDKKAYLKTQHGEDQHLFFEVDILETKREYGRKRYMVKPCQGTGKAWVEKLSFKVALKK